MILAFDSKNPCDSPLRSKTHRSIPSAPTLFASISTIDVILLARLPRGLLTSVVDIPPSVDTFHNYRSVMIITT